MPPREERGALDPPCAPRRARRRRDEGRPGNPTRARRAASNKGLEQGRGGAAYAAARSCSDLLRLQPVQIIGGTLRMAAAVKIDRLSFFNTCSHDRDIGGVILANLRRDAEIGAEKRRAELGNQLFAWHSLRRHAARGQGRAPGACRAWSSGCSSCASVAA